MGEARVDEVGREAQMEVLSQGDGERKLVEVGDSRVQAG